jgi:replicative DNA helicase
MSLDLTLLRILKYRDHYDRIVPSLPGDALDKRTMTVLQDMGAFLSETGHPVVKVGPFKSYFFNFKHPNLPEDVRKYYDRVLDNIEKDVDEATTRVMANKLIELGFATDVANLASNYHRGDEVDIIPAVDHRVDTAKSHIISGDTDRLYVDDSISDLLAEDEDDEGIAFGLNCLASNLRPLRPGDLVIVAGRPDTGKTSFIASELRTMVKTIPADRPAIWFNNEGEGNRIIKRLYQAMLGSNIDELIELKDEGTIEQLYAEAGGDRVQVIDCHDWTTTMVEQVVGDVKPSLVIFDMIDNLEFSGEMRLGHDQRTDQILESQYQWGRKLGVKHGFPVMATSQVSAEAEHQAETQCWPAMHMLKDSKTGKQGAADLMIMIGLSSDPMCANDRYISTPKNKLGRPRGQRYVRQQVNFDIARATYSDPV